MEEQFSENARAFGSLNFLTTVFEERSEDISNLRQEVFVREQNVPVQLEFNDEEERASLYFVCYHGSKIVGCIRLREINQVLVKLERVAVLQEYRRRGIARQLIINGLKFFLEDRRNSLLYAFAQSSAIQLYLKLGFSVVSEKFEEEGTDIDHFTIVFPLERRLRNFLINGRHEFKDYENKPHFEIHDEVVVQRLHKLLKQQESLELFNFCSLPLLLDSDIISGTICSRFANYCYLASTFMHEHRENILDKTLLQKIGSEEEFLFGLANDKLNTGHFMNVEENWRVLFGMISFVSAFLLWKIDSLEKSLETADRGLCMGRVNEEFVPLRSLAEKIHDILVTDQNFSIHPEYIEKNEVNFDLRPLVKSRGIKEISSDEDLLEAPIKALIANEPLIIRKLAVNFPAFYKWSFDYLCTKLYNRTIPVEIGSKYSDEDWSQRMMKFSEFISTAPEKKYYLAQHRLLDQVPSLRKDIPTPDISLANDDSCAVDVNLWIGPSGTVSPLHTDPRHNMFVQIRGSKTLRLVAPKDSEGVYPIEGMLSNTSQVDAENPSLEQHPKFGDVEVFDGIVEEGDGILLPKGWWHYLRSISPSISVSFWFD
ncbi:unnamed protein product [Caenorhabditis auriculariae]|uniref:Uncharacterized protein n=1 Tax=Caenorhabditis auriculariae TaxID=2777116 RepID=A0A8S1HGA1_9PELO|nr:unnamed protein product [Caenorhabditis auriculariae]